MLAKMTSKNQITLPKAIARKPMVMVPDTPATDQPVSRVIGCSRTGSENMPPMAVAMGLSGGGVESAAVVCVVDQGPCATPTAATRISVSDPYNAETVKLLVPVLPHWVQVMPSLLCSMT